MNYSCSSNRMHLSNNSLFQCMSKQTEETGIGFYGELEKFKKDLLSNKLIKDRSKDSYVKALKQINQKDNKWGDFYKKYHNQSYFTSIKENFNYFVLNCCDLPIRFKGFDSIKPNLINIQKFNLYKLSNTPVNDSDILYNLFLATDVSKKIDNLNLILIILLHLDANFNPNTTYMYRNNDN